MPEFVGKRAFLRKGTASTKTQTGTAGHFQGKENRAVNQGKGIGDHVFETISLFAQSYNDWLKVHSKVFMT